MIKEPILFEVFRGKRRVMCTIDEKCIPSPTEIRGMRKAGYSCRTSSQCTSQDNIK